MQLNAPAYRNILGRLTKTLRWRVSYLLIRTSIYLLRLSGWYEGYWANWRHAFTYVERSGLHILPVHYYSPIPDTGELPNTLWSNIRTCPGFDLRLESAVAWLMQLHREYGCEFSELPRDRAGPRDYYLNNSAFGSGDAEVLYAIVRQLKPRRIVEIGSGYSTLLTCQAIRATQNESTMYQCEFVAIEPFPPLLISPPPKEVLRVEKTPVQSVPLELFASLNSGDILFIDSSHVARIGSDVVYEYLTILPHIPPGVVVHIHDIFTPAEYPRRWFDEARFFWNEQYILEAFLNYNDQFEVIMPLHAVWQAHTQLLQRIIPSIESARNPPSSFWIRRRCR